TAAISRDTTTRVEPRRSAAVRMMCLFMGSPSIPQAYRRLQRAHDRSVLQRLFHREAHEQDLADAVYVETGLVAHAVPVVVVAVGDLALQELAHAAAQDDPVLVAADVAREDEDPVVDQAVA